MARAWSFQSAGRTVFGPGCILRIGEVLEQLGARTCLLVTDAHLAAYARLVTDAAAAEGIECMVFDESEAEPAVAVVEALMEAAGDAAFDAVIGLGGGSNIDVAKAGAILLAHGGSIGDYAGQGNVPGAVVPIVAVPTTAGSGSEVSAACILSVPADNTKLAVVDNAIRPAVAIVDPELHRTCPPAVTRDAGIDALCHAVEAFTIADWTAFPRADDGWPVYQGKHPFTDTLAERAIEMLSAALPEVAASPEDLDVRCRMAMGAHLAGVAMSNTGLYTVHALTYPVGAFTHASHGACNGALLPAVLDFVAPVRPAETKRIVELMKSDRAGAGDAVRDLLRRVGAPATLRELGLQPGQIEPAARIGYEIRRLMNGSPRPTSRGQLLEIVRRAYGEPP